MTTLTPSCKYSLTGVELLLTEGPDHAEQYSPDDNRFDLRPFLYPSWFGFKVIEEKIAAMGENGQIPQPEGKKDA